MLYFIVGASLSGKTTIRRFLQKRYGISGIDSDTLRTMAEVLSPDLNVNHARLPKHNYDNMVSYIDAFIYARSFFPEEDFIIEGDCISLADLYKKSPRSRVVVLGYPTANDSNLLERVLNGSKTHWSSGLTKNRLKLKAKSFIEFSKFLEQEANKYGYPFLDVSSSDIESVTRWVEKELGLIK